MSKRLPGSAQQIADVIGMDATLELIRRLPRQFDKEHPSGRPALYVPKTIPPNHRLVEWIGWDAAVKLSRYYGGDFLFVATCSSASKAPRNADIVAALKEASPAVVASRFGMSERQVRRIAAAARSDVSSMGSRAVRSDHAPVHSQAIAA